MAWVKIPPEHHPLFMAALPKDPRVTTMRMFGGLAGMVNGQMFSGLFARSALVKLSAADQQEALALDGSAPFDPMGNGRIMKDTILLAEEVMDDPQALRDWLRRSLDFALTLPARARPAPKAKPAAKAPPAAKAKLATRSKSESKSKPQPESRSAAARPRRGR